MKENKKIIGRILAAGLAVFMVISLLTGTSGLAAVKVGLSRSKVTVGIGESTTVKVKNTRKRISCKILSGKKNISIQKKKKSVKITGKKPGKAKLQIRAGNKKMTCRITVTGKRNTDIANGAKISVKSGKYTITYQLNDSRAAKELYAQLPLTIKVENYSDNEKIFYPPKELKTSGTPKSKGRKGSLAYYAPWGDVVMFYESAGSASGLYELGTVVSGKEHISKLSGKITVSKLLSS